MNRLAGKSDQLMNALDQDDREALRKFAYFKDPNLAGPQPVDEDPDGRLCREAIREHFSNFYMPDFITEFRFSDSALPYDPTFTPAVMSPYHYAAEIRPEVAIYGEIGRASCRERVCQYV